MFAPHRHERVTSHDPLLPTDDDTEENTNHGEHRMSLTRPRSASFDPMDIPEASSGLPVTRVVLVRALALLCACSLSIGSHYASYILGPLKSRLSREMGTSNTEFSLLISAFSLNSTWTPLVGGILASRLGTTTTSILATGIIFLGQVLLLVGDISGNIRLMTFGMFVFGLGVSPLAVVQETIIVRFFKSHGLGISMALGLVAGKGASFVSAHTSYPLTERYGPHAPFYAATSLAGLSVIMNLVYLSASKWLVAGSGAELEASDIYDEAQRRSSRNLTEAQALNEVAKKRKVNLREVTKLGDVFWAYIGLNVLCGAIWQPFTHLAANVLERRYHLSELDASNKASYLLAGSVILYPICGFVVDRLKHGQLILRLFMLSSCLTLFAYIWLALPPTWTRSSIPAIAFFGTGIGFSPLLLVVLVPQLVPSKYVSTTLGAHKSLEQTGSTIFQTLAGLSLDAARRSATHRSPSNSPAQDAKSVQHLLNALLTLNVLQFCSIIGLSYLDRRRRQTVSQTGQIAIGTDESVSALRKVEDPVEVNPWVGDDLSESPSSSSQPQHRRSLVGSERSRFSSFGLDIHLDQSPSEKSAHRRGEIFAGMCAGAIAFAWALFLGTAWLKLRSKEERGGT